MLLLNTYLVFIKAYYREKKDNFENINLIYALHLSRIIRVINFLIFFQLISTIKYYENNFVIVIPYLKFLVDLFVVVFLHIMNDVRVTWKFVDENILLKVSLFLLISKIGYFIRIWNYVCLKRIVKKGVLILAPKI